MSILEFFSGKRNPKRIKITRTDSGNQWMVKKGYQILYIGTKKKCEIYMENTLLM